MPRISIRVQLALLVLLTTMVALAVVSIATWEFNYNFVVGITSDDLALTASVKAASIAADLTLIHSTCATIITRILLQQAIAKFYTGTNVTANFVNATTDIQSGLDSGGSANLLQAIVYSRNATGNPAGILNVTGLATPFPLPSLYPNGSNVMFGDAGLGFPPTLYPNISYPQNGVGRPVTSFGLTLTNSTVIVLGPLQVNASYALISITLPILTSKIAITANYTTLAYITVVAEATLIQQVLSSREGLGSTGQALLIGPTATGNLFPLAQSPSNGTSFSPNTTALQSAPVNYVFPPTPLDGGQEDRHPNHKYGNPNAVSFPLSSYPAALSALTENNMAINNGSSDLSAKNEQGYSVSVGVARPNSKLVNWVLVVEQAYSEAYTPVMQLKKILLGCVFGTAGLIILIVFPLAHFSVLPILRLKEATLTSIRPPGYFDADGLSVRSDDSDIGETPGDVENVRSTSQNSKKKGRFFIRMRELRRGKQRKSKAERGEDAQRRVFKIPGKVQTRKHFIKDELTELTATFNDMSDELMTQYSRLEDRVKERTYELELSKKAAEAANESKTLFIANISHELRTPLNGILGMTAVCLGEDDLPRIKRSLQVVYKSGDLLLNLLNDLLTFSKNQIGQQLSLEEREFGLSDIKSQITTIFDKQVREGKIKFGVKFVGTDTDAMDTHATDMHATDGNLSSDGGEKSGAEWIKKPNGKALPALGPQGTGRLKDMRLWGDQHRILQVIINLVSNSLKFTPEGGSVQVRIRCTGEVEKSSDASRNSMTSNPSKRGSERSSRLERGRHRVGSDSKSSVTSRVGSSSNAKPAGTALLINPMNPKSAQSYVQVRERTPTPPPVNAKQLLFSFEVQDSGPGIKPEFQERVFEPFVQGDLGLNKKYGGTGLGLSICSQLAGLMGGKISLDSAVGVGSTFTMTIPLKYVKERAASTASSSLPGSRPPSMFADDKDVNHRIPGDQSPSGAIKNGNPISFEKDTQPRLVGLSQPFFASAPVTPPAVTQREQLAALDRARANKSSSGRIRVLVAEDNLVNQEVVLRMLKLEDVYNVTIAKDGQEAYDIVKASMEEGKAFDLIFMDIQMPNLDGLQSTRLIRGMNYAGPIVALTAFAEESNVKECMDSGMDMFLSKPIRRPALKQVLKKFAPIPEEPEGASLSQKTSSDSAQHVEEESPTSTPLPASSSVNGVST